MSAGRPVHVPLVWLIIWAASSIYAVAIFSLGFIVDDRTYLVLAASWVWSFLIMECIGGTISIVKREGYEVTRTLSQFLQWFQRLDRKRDGLGIATGFDALVFGIACTIAWNTRLLVAASLRSELSGWIAGASIGLWLWTHWLHRDAHDRVRYVFGGPS